MPDKQKRHNEIRDTFAKFMDEVCHDVKIEHPSQSKRFDDRSTTTEIDTHPVIKANGFLESRFTAIFFDVKIFNP